MIAAVATTGLSITAAILDAKILDEKAFLPRRLCRWLNRDLDDAAIARYKLWRRVLEKLILSFADQQLITGFSIVLTAYIKRLFINKNQASHFVLVVYLACLSSSSHLAALVVLGRYFEENPKSAWLRVMFIGSFAALLVVALAMSPAFGPFFLAYRALTYLLSWVVVLDWLFFPGIEYIVSSWPIVWLFWTASVGVVQQRDTVEHWMRNKLWPFVVTLVAFVLTYPLVMAAVVTGGLPKTLTELAWKTRTPARKARDTLRRWLQRIPVPMKVSATWKMLISPILAAAFWFSVFSNATTSFILQAMFAIMSCVLALTQKFMRPTKSCACLCSLNTKEGNAFGFGQILTFLLLILPLFSAYEAYLGKSTIALHS